MKGSSQEIGLALKIHFIKLAIETIGEVRVDDSVPIRNAIQDTIQEHPNRI